MHRARDIGWSVIDQFLAGELDEVYVVYTRMENSVQTDAEKLKLLPLEAKDFGSMKMPLNMYREAIELYPSADSVMAVSYTHLDVYKRQKSGCVFPRCATMICL